MTSQVRNSVRGSVPRQNADEAALEAEKMRRWRLEHADAIRAENEDIERRGLPLTEYRLF